MSYRLKQIVALSLLAAIILGWFTIGRYAPVTSNERRPDILFIIIDTFGHQWTTKSSGDPSLTPALEALGKNGVVFTEARSAAPWTKPSIMAMMSGLMPSSHGMTRLGTRKVRVEETLAEALQRAGYKTAGVVSHTLIGPKTAFARGFDSYEIVPLKHGVHGAITSSLVAARAEAILAEHRASNDSRPLFLFAHFFDPHFRYHDHPDHDRVSWYSGELRSGMSIKALGKRVPTMTENDKRYLRGLYGEEIEYTDRHVGSLLRTFEKTNGFVAVTADHGEEFFEHGFIGHTRSLYEELIHVPLIISWPRLIPARTIETPVSNIDLFSTILEIGSAPPPNYPIQSRSLLPVLLDASGVVGERTVISEVDYATKRATISFTSGVRGDLKAVLNPATGGWECYNLASDPKEQSSSCSPAFDSLRADVSAYVAAKELTGGVPPEETPTSEELKQLKSLGYL